MRRFIIAALASLAAGGTLAQSTYPSRPISMVVGFAPGGGQDIAARIIVKRFSENIGASVIVENRAGAGGEIAAEYVSRANPDGHVFLLGNVGSMAVAPHQNPKLPYNPLRDFAPITMAVVFANVLVVHASLPVNSVADYVKLAGSKPGGIAYGT